MSTSGEADGTLDELSRWPAPASFIVPFSPGEAI